MARIVRVTYKDEYLCRVVVVVCVCVYVCVVVVVTEKKEKEKEIKKETYPKMCALDYHQTFFWRFQNHRLSHDRSCTKVYLRV